MTVTSQQWSVVVAPEGWEFAAPDYMSILEAAQFSNYTLPSSCRNGTCRTCICQMLSGQIRYRIEWPGLSIDEKKAGYILPCVAYAESDVLIHSPAAKRTKQP